MPIALMNSIPLVLLFFGTLLFVLAATEVGHRFGRRRRKRSDDEKTEPVGAMGGTLLGLLAFMLAFTFGVSADRFDNRRDLVLEEANAIGTAHLRAEFLPESNRVQSRSLMREYVQVRLDWAAREEKGDVIHSEKLQQQLWATALEGAKTAEPEYSALYIESLNEVFDQHEKRVLARSHIPGTIWVALYLLTLLAFAASGYHAGLHASSRSPVSFAVALGFSIVIILVADLDRPMDGLISVNQRAMQDLQQAIGKP